MKNQKETIVFSMYFEDIISKFSEFLACKASLYSMDSKLQKNPLLEERFGFQIQFQHTKI